MAYNIQKNPNVVEIYGKKYINSPKPCRRYGHIGLHYLGGKCVECDKADRQKVNKEKREITAAKLKKRKSVEEHITQANKARKEWRKKRIKEFQPKERENERKQRRDFPYIHLLRSAKVRARKNGLEYRLTREWAKTRWMGKCELTGIDFQYFEEGKIGYFYSASLDRIDNSIGYLPDNCRFILYALNIMKGQASDHDVYKIALAVINNHG